MLKKCEVCGLILDSELIQDRCPKCQADASRFRTLSREETEKITQQSSDQQLAYRISGRCRTPGAFSGKGIADQLDPGCIQTFELALRQAVLLRQMIRAEIAIHTGKEKW